MRMLKICKKSKQNFISHKILCLKLHCLHTYIQKVSFYNIESHALTFSQGGHNDGVLRCDIWRGLSVWKYTLELLPQLYRRHIQLCCFSVGPASHGEEGEFERLYDTWGSCMSWYFDTRTRIESRLVWTVNNLKEMSFLFSLEYSHAKSIP